MYQIETEHQDWSETLYWFETEHQENGSLGEKKKWVTTRWSGI